MLPRLVKLAPVVLLTAVLTSLLLPAAPASADLIGTTSSRDLVLKNKCVRHPISYSFAVSPDTLLWQTKITLVSPTGRTSEGIDLSSVDDDPTSGTVTVMFCGSADPGTWTVHTVGSYQIVPLVNIPISVADSTFQVSRTVSRTTLTGKHLAGNRYRLVATVKDQRKSGFKPTSSAEVSFQRKVDGVWTTIRGAKAETTKGVASTVVTVAGGTKVRAVTASAGYLGGSTSRAVRLHR